MSAGGRVDVFAKFDERFWIHNEGSPKVISPRKVVVRRLSPGVCPEFFVETMRGDVKSYLESLEEHRGKFQRVCSTYFTCSRFLGRFPRFGPFFFSIMRAVSDPFLCVYTSRGVVFPNPHILRNVHGV